MSRNVYIGTRQYPGRLTTDHDAEVCRISFAHDPQEAVKRYNEHIGYSSPAVRPEKIRLERVS